MLQRPLDDLRAGIWLVSSTTDTANYLEDLESQQWLGAVKPNAMRSCAAAALQFMAWALAARDTNRAVADAFKHVVNNGLTVLHITLERTKLQPEQLQAALQPVAGSQAPGGWLEGACSR